MGTDLPCTDRSPSLITPTSGKIFYLLLLKLNRTSVSVRLTPSNLCVVHELRPADIKVVAAVGDSLTVSAHHRLLFHSKNLKHTYPLWKNDRVKLNIQQTSMLTAISVSDSNLARLMLNIDFTVCKKKKNEKCI